MDPSSEGHYSSTSQVLNKSRTCLKSSYSADKATKSLSGSLCLSHAVELSPAWSTAVRICLGNMEVWKRVWRLVRFQRAGSGLSSPNDAPACKLETHVLLHSAGIRLYATSLCLLTQRPPAWSNTQPRKRQRPKVQGRRQLGQ